jgi:hypothetical protein
VGYRQHATNDVGATRGRIRDLADLIDRLRRWQASGDRLRRDLHRMATQAETFRSRYGLQLTASDQQFLEELAALPHLPLWRRKRSLLRHRLRAEYGIMRNLGLLLRA